MEVTNMEKNNDNNEIEAFLAQVEEQGGATNTGKYISRDRLAVPIDEETNYSELHTGYILEGYTSGIEGKYGESTAVRMVAPESGRRVTLWLTGYEQEHLKAQVSGWTDDGASYPFEVQFLRHKVASKNGSGRKYNRFTAQLLSNGDAITLPPVPEDQYEEATADSDN